MSKKVEQKAFEAYQENRSRKPKYQIGDDYWMDWFSKGYHEALKESEWRNFKEVKPEPNRILALRWRRLDGGPFSYTTDASMNVNEDLELSKYDYEWKYID